MASATGDPAVPSYFELRQYHMPYGSKQRLLHDFLRDAFIPAANRLRVSPVGVFNVLYGPNSPSLYVLIQHPDLTSVVGLRKLLEEDQEYRQAGPIS